MMTEVTSGEGVRIVTVRGPVSPATLGMTLSHDHLLCDAWAIQERYDVILDNEDLAIKEVERYAAAGGGAICDPTNIGLGRNPEALRRISKRTGVHVVMGAGWYRERTYPDYVFEEMPDELAERLIHEIIDGVDDTGIRPGFIGEIGTERYRVTPAEERVFRAAGRAHRRTGCPIMTHTTHFGELALEQLSLLEEEGVDPRSVIISHLGDRPGVSWWLPIADRGAWLGIDNLGSIAGFAPLAVRADNVKELCDAGFADRILLSNDVCETGHLAFYGGSGYDNVIRNFVPMLRDRGVTEEEIVAMTHANPARAFAYNARGAGRSGGPDASA